jgi:hypothetical protein
MDLSSFFFGMFTVMLPMSGLAWALWLRARRPPPGAAQSTVYHVEVVEGSPAPEDVKSLTHVLEWDPDDYWALQESAGDGRWSHAMSGDRASMERRLDHRQSTLAGQLSNFRAQQTPLPEGGPAWERWERKIEHLSQVDYRLVPDRRWRRHSLGVEPALEQIRQRLRMPSDKLRIRPLEDPERDELMTG